MTTDPALPGAAELLDGRARSVLEPAVAAGGGHLRGARPTQVRYQPGDRLAVRFAAEVTWGDGSERVETLGAVVDARGLPDGLAVVERDDGARVGVWRYPYDPWLPGLVHVAAPSAAATTLAAMGLSLHELSVRPVVYRPGGRAILRVTGGERTVYVKVQRPGKAAALQRIHDALAGLAPVPRCLGADDGLGLVVLEARPGRPLSRALVDGGPLPDPLAMFAPVDAIRDVPPPAPPLSGCDVAHQHAGLLAQVLPALAPRVHAVAGTVTDPPVDGTIHGDFYEAQVLVDGGRVTGLLDVDGARGGAALDDPASLVGHLVALAQVHPAAAGRIAAYRRKVERALGPRGGGEEFRAAVATRLLGIATMPFRRQEPDWQDRTETWLRLAEGWALRRVHEDSLSPVS